jgi:PAS domain S-box-containing protein
VPLIPTFEASRFVRLAQRTRDNPLFAYGAALACVAAATLLRIAFMPFPMQGAPFTTFYPAIIVATIFGGLWPGILATLLSAVVAWFVFIPPQFTFELTKPELVSLLLFLVISGVNIALVTMLNKAVERLVTQERNIRVLVEGAPNGVVVVDEFGMIRTVNKNAEKLFGYDRSEMVGHKVELLLPKGERLEHLAHRQQFMRNPEARPMGVGRDLTALRKDGKEVPVEIGLSPVERDHKLAVLATVVDISERKHAEERQRFLISELRHRSQNLFAVVQSIAARTLEEGKSLAGAKKILEGRLMALSRAHTMLADAAWTGARLDEIIKSELTAFADHVSVMGCALLINTPAAQQFALIVHELATNAAKYGALRVPTGKVIIDGKVERVNGEQIFAMAWRESGGPRVRKPRRSGFGSTILVEGARKFGRHADLRFQPEGISYELRLPLSGIMAQQSPPPSSMAP